MMVQDGQVAFLFRDFGVCASRSAPRSGVYFTRCDPAAIPLSASGYKVVKEKNDR